MDGPEPFGYTNHLKKIERINEFTRKLNNAGFKISSATGGTRSRAAKRDADGNLTIPIMHRFSDWREPELEKSFHLTDNGRAIMFNATIKFVEHKMISTRGNQVAPNKICFPATKTCITGTETSVPETRRPKVSRSSIWSTLTCPDLPQCALGIKCILCCGCE